MKWLAVVLVVSACKTETPPDPECVVLVNKIIKCDPTAPASLKDDPSAHCTPRACARLPTSTPAECTRFMGCLYDGS